MKRPRKRFQKITSTSSSVCQLEAPFNLAFTAPLEPAGDHGRRTPRGSGPKSDDGPLLHCSTLDSTARRLAAMGLPSLRHR
eukprot:703199-Prymnesium_polylepis.1